MLKFQSSGVVPDRQESSHPHGAYHFKVSQIFTGSVLKRSNSTHTKQRVGLYRMELVKLVEKYT